MMTGVAREIASRLKIPERVNSILASYAVDRAKSRSVPWRAYGLAKGYAGLALFFGYLDRCFADEGWDVSAHGCLQLAVRDAEQQSQLPMGLFEGLTGVAFAGDYLSRDGSRYHRLLSTLDTRLIPWAAANSAYLAKRSEGVAVGEYDLISGLTGVGAYFLSRRDLGNAQAGLEPILKALIWLTETSDGLPRWHTPAHLTNDEELRERYPRGHLNCGLAHGISGPLALLALAHTLGISVPGLEDAIDRIAGWLSQQHKEDAWGGNWASLVPLTTDDSVNNDPLPAPRNQARWCYGSPGIGRALWLAGNALNKPQYCDLSVAALRAVLCQAPQERGLSSPTFCHGIAGLLHVTLRFARDTGIAAFWTSAEGLCNELLDLYSPHSALGYVSIEAHGRCVEHPGLLDGATGTALVLAAAATGEEPAWDRLFLLA